MLTRALTFAALFITFSSAASAETIGQWARGIEVKLQDKIETFCPTAKYSELCRADFTEVQTISLITQLKFQRMMVPLNNLKDKHVTDLDPVVRLDVRAYKTLLQNELAKLEEKYGK